LLSSLLNYSTNVELFNAFWLPMRLVSRGSGSHLSQKARLIRRGSFAWKLAPHLHIRRHTAPGGQSQNTRRNSNGSQETREKDQEPKEGEKARSSQAT
jgi:hypothetical protein